MFREFIAHGSQEWVSILPILNKNYNNFKYRTIGMKPVQADKNPLAVMLKQRTIENRKVKFSICDKVRISTLMEIFTKGYLPNQSTEISTIVKANKTSAPAFILKDYTKKPIIGCLYFEELYKTNYPNEYLANIFYE